MKSYLSKASLALGMLMALHCTPAEAHFSLGDSPGGIVYRGTAAFHSVPSLLTDAFHAGPWSWEDGSGAGWTETSVWYKVHLDLPGTFVLTISREVVPLGGGGESNIDNMFPSFTLWSGIHDAGTFQHAFNNEGAVTWAPELTYITHVDNMTLDTITASIPLAAGEYTLVIGSHSTVEIPTEQGFRANFQLVPEPSTAALLTLCGATLFAGRRRKIA